MLSVIFHLITGLSLFLFFLHYIYYICCKILSYAMQSEDAKFLKRKVKSGAIDVHPTESALIVNYEVEATLLGELGDPVLGERKGCQKIIRLKNLSAKTDCAALAQEVIEKCNLIHMTKLKDVEHLICYLKHRNSNFNDRSVKSPQQNSGSMSPGEKPDGMTEKAIIGNIEEYVELLYEDIPEKIKGSALLLQLARNPDNLLGLSQNETVLCALSRVLREDWKRSIDLSTNLVYTFFCFSTYTRFHPIILQYKIGSLCMDVIDYELKRYDQWKNDIETRKKLCEGNNISTENLNNEATMSIEDIKSPILPDPPKRRIPELKQRPKSGNWTDQNSLIRSKLMNNSYHENLCSDIDLQTTTDIKKIKEDFDKMKRQFKSLTRKQEQLLRIAFYLLINIAEDVKVEEKMRKKNIVGLLVKTLERNNFELLILIVTFLKKLSIVADNKDDMSELNIIEKLPRLLLSSNQDLVHVSLKLLYNLSFDSKLRLKMIRVGFLPKLVSLLSDDKHYNIVIKILYHLSIDDKVKSMFTYTDCVTLVTDMLLLCMEKTVDMDLIALCINLAVNKRNAQLMVENNRLQDLMSRAVRFEDSLIIKLLRNIAMHDTTKHKFVKFIDDITGVLTTSENEDFVVECVGLLGCLALPEIDYTILLQNYNLVPWIRTNLIPGKREDDLCLEVVVLLGTAACDEACAMLLCKADILLSLIELLKAKQEDDEIVLQIIFVFYQVLRHESTREYLTKETDAAAYLIDLMHDKNTEIQKVCDSCLDIIAISDEGWASRIKLEKFREHNSQWLNMVESHAVDSHDFDPSDELDLPAYLTTDFMSNDIPHGPGSGSDSRASLNNDDCDAFRAISALDNYSRPGSRSGLPPIQNKRHAAMLPASFRNPPVQSGLRRFRHIVNELKPFAKYSIARKRKRKRPKPPR
ncbi:kinesin-associated protein 3-like [Ctenocephalides felis]|uniref:kinesin-associated protein 3-like n=1 Tax=Ctenocephalides felis TaxID=7515 RepID=UPI000E6E36AA|nr:kinesin-associated protein 3-like [Ctenocephalides felis]